MRVLSGIVLDEEGNPVAGTMVVGPYMKRRAHGTCHPGLSFETATDDEGRFTGALPRMPAERERRDLLELVLAGGFVPESLPAPPGAWESLDAGRSVVDLRVVLRRCAAVEGVVRDGDGRPVPGARVEFLLPGPDGEPHSFASPDTDGSGMFRRADLDPREPWEIRTEILGVASVPISVGGLLDPARPLPVELLLPDFHRAAIGVRDSGADEGTFLYIDGICAGEGDGRDRGRSWEVEATVGRHLVELWTGDRLRVRVTVEPTAPGERILVEVDGAGSVKVSPVPLSRGGCHMPPGVTPPDSRPPEDPPPPADGEGAG